MCRTHFTFVVIKHEMTSVASHCLNIRSEYTQRQQSTGKNLNEISMNRPGSWSLDSKTIPVNSSTRSYIPNFRNFNSPRDTSVESTEETGCDESPTKVDLPVANPTNKPRVDYALSIRILSQDRTLASESCDIYECTVKAGKLECLSIVKNYKSLPSNKRALFIVECRWLLPMIVDGRLSIVDDCRWWEGFIYDGLPTSRELRESCS